MFSSIASIDLILQCLSPAFTQPSLLTHVEVFLGWVMCLSKRTEYAVFQTIQADTPISRKQRHPFDRFYNFFSRSAWSVHDLAYQVAVAIVVQLNPCGLLYLVVDDTLLHKRGKHVYGLGWFRDAVASTAKRVVTASGNHWVVVGLAIRIPGTNKIYCLPIHAKLHLSGKNQPSRGQAAGPLDWKIVALDAVGLLFFFVPGVVAFAVDFSNGTIYLPTEEYGSADRSTSSPELRQFKMSAAGISYSQIEDVVSKQVGREVRLLPGKYETRELRSIDEFWETVQTFAKA